MGLPDRYECWFNVVTPSVAPRGLTRSESAGYSGGSGTPGRRATSSRELESRLVRSTSFMPTGAPHARARTLARWAFPGKGLSQWVCTHGCARGHIADAAPPRIPT